MEIPFPYIKALHIIFVVTWFAGLFYIVRLFIYHTEALQQEEPSKSILSEKLGLMSRRLWYVIAWPSAIITLILGLWTLYERSAHLQHMYMWIKIGLVFLLYVYHFICHIIYRDLQKGIVRYSSGRLRVWNEIATILLIGIVFLIVVRDSLGLVWGLGGLATLMIIFVVIIRVYGKNRKSAKE